MRSEPPVRRCLPAEHGTAEHYKAERARSPHRRVAALIALCAASFTSPPPVTAQSELTIEVGASQIGPPLGVSADHARFMIGGLRASRYTTGGSAVFGSVLFGQTLNGSTGGSFLSGAVEGSLVARWTPSVSGSLGLRILGWGVDDPFPYRAVAAEGGPSVRVGGERASLEISGVFGIGRSRLELWREDAGPTRVFQEDLWRTGAVAELMLGPATSSFGVAGGYHDTPGGDYGSVGARALFAGRWGAAELRLDRWKTPVGNETTGGIALIVPLGAAWSVRGFFGRTEPDPLTLAQPGVGSGGLLVGRSLLATKQPERVAPQPYEIVRPGDDRSRVRLGVVAPAGAVDVRLVGDFTLWEPVEMSREGDRWVVELDIASGTHHFGFLVDDEWFVPDDAPNVVQDEWGRPTATLVIEGARQ